MKQALLLDEGVPLRARSELMAAGWDVGHVLDLGMAGASDHEVLGVAAERGAVLVCFDSDFHQILARSGAVSPSVIRLRIQPLEAHQFPSLMSEVFDKASVMLKEGAVVTVTDASIRGRRLPIRL